MSQPIYEHNETKCVKSLSESYNGYFQVDTLTNKKITGWVRTHSKKNNYLVFQHYDKGTQNGPLIGYELKDSVFKLVTYSTYYNDRFEKSISYNNTNDTLIIENIYFHNNLNNFFLSRNIKIKNEKIRVKDEFSIYGYYMYKSKKIKYKVDNLEGVYNEELYPFHYPKELNEILKPFTFLKFKGYYTMKVLWSKRNTAKFHPKPDTLYPKFYNENDSTYQIDTLHSYEVNIKFNANGTFLQIKNNELTEKFTNWNSVKVVSGKYWFEGNKLKLTYTNSSHFIILSAKFYNGISVFEYKTIQDVIRRSSFDFVLE